MNRAAFGADTPWVPYKPEGSYFVRLDEAAPPSRNIPLGREQHWADGPGPRGPVPAHKRRKRRIRIRPVWVLAIVVFGWLGWAYTTPGGPSARIRQWIDQTRGDVANATANPDLHQTAVYFNGLYASQGAYPNMSDTAIEEAPSSGFGVSMNFVWCSPQAVVLQSLSSGGSLSRLLLNGKDLGNVQNSRGCPANLQNPVPWKLAKSKTKSK